MKAFLFSTGESTTELCKWSLERLGIEVVLLESQSTLCDKLEETYHMAEDDFLRVDADMVVNRNMLEFVKSAQAMDEIWWLQGRIFDFYKMDVGYCTPSYIKKEALPALRANVGKFTHAVRPETEFSRIKEFYEPRRFGSLDIVVGIHGIGQDKETIQRTKANKLERDQYELYDWELAEKVSEL